MMYKRLFLASLTCLFFSLILLTSCQKGYECTGIVFTYVEDEKTGAKTPVGACQLTIGDISFAEEMYREVVTNASGYYEGTWIREAYLLVEAIKPLNEEQYLYGIGYLDLVLKNKTELSIPMEVKNY